MEQDKKLQLLKMKVGFVDSILNPFHWLCMLLIDLIAGYGIL